MYIDKDSKVILLPTISNNNQSEFKIVQLPTSNNLQQLKSYLINQSTIYELNEIKGQESNKIKLKTGDAVKSFIIESTDSDGAIIQSSKMIISSKFNIIYLLISIIYSSWKGKSSNFISIDDLMDRLSWAHELPIDVFSKAMPMICDDIIEGGEVFYKFSKVKAFEFVNDHIVKLKEYYFAGSANNENTIIGKIKGELNDPTIAGATVKDDGGKGVRVLEALTLSYAIDYICDSYIENLIKFKQELIDHFKYDFNEMNEYLDQLKQKKKDIAIVESNMNELITTSVKNNKKKNETTKKVTKTKKKEVKKVAVGKGALDGFFKRT